MSDLLERVRGTGLLSPDRPVVVLLSGGRDSVCLLGVAVELTGAANVSALHIDYGLRAESKADAALCRALCATLDVAVEVVDAPGPPEAGENLQAWARSLRYERANELAGPRDADI